MYKNLSQIIVAWSLKDISVFLFKIGINKILFDLLVLKVSFIQLILKILKEMTVLLIGIK